MHVLFFWIIGTIQKKMNTQLDTAKKIISSKEFKNG